MSPAEHAASANQLRRVLRDLGADLSTLEQLAVECARLSAEGQREGLAAGLALALHHYYTALESALGRAVRQLDGSLPGGQDWHQALLHEAYAPIPDVRGPLLSSATRADVDELRRFRHFLRHAYAVALDWDRLLELATRLANAHPTLVDDLTGVRGALRRAVDALDPPSV